MKESMQLTTKEFFSLLDKLIESGAEVHVIDKSRPDEIVEHIFGFEHEPEVPDEEIPFCEDECAECPYADEIYDGDEEDIDPPLWGIPDIDRIVYSGPATIVFWMDGTKTVVRCMPGEKFERYAGFAAACMKKMFGSTSRAKAIMNELATEQVPKAPKKPVPEEPVKQSNYPGEIGEVIQEAVNEAFNG